MSRWPSGARLGGLIVAATFAAACSSDGSTSRTTTAERGSTPASLPGATSVPGVASSVVVRHLVCAPLAHADCSYAKSFAPPIAASADLTGIDLRNAVIGADVNLSGALLDGAHLDGATVKASLKNADLTDASLAGADLSQSDLTGATVTGATLTGAHVNASVIDTNDLSTTKFTNVTIGVRSGETLAGARFNGFDLTGVRFASDAHGRVSMGGAQFTNATLTGASFFRIDLTGADFSGAVFAAGGGPEPTFTETTCPDFLPSDSKLSGRAACRL
ncbi:MAG: pentapeptide repeat-containing protein [Ilumatobacteraceae bacterium]